MGSTKFAFLADAVLEHVRAGHLPGEEDAELLNRIGVVDELRTRVRPDDVVRLMDVVERSSTKAAGLAISLLRMYSDREDVSRYLREKFLTSKDALLRFHLVWRILDDPGLPPEWHERIFEFLLDNPDLFRTTGLQWVGGREETIQNVDRRLADPTFPGSKKWVYLFHLMFADDRERAGQLLEQARTGSDDPFTRRVANELLERFSST